MFPLSPIQLFAQALSRVHDPPSDGLEVLYIDCDHLHRVGGEVEVPAM